MNKIKRLNKNALLAKRLLICNKVECNIKRWHKTDRYVFLFELAIYNPEIKCLIKIAKIFKCTYYISMSDNNKFLEFIIYRHNKN